MTEPAGYEPRPGLRAEEEGGDHPPVDDTLVDHLAFDQRRRDQSVQWDGLPMAPVDRVAEMVGLVRDLAERRGVRIGLGVIAVLAAGMWWLIAGSASTGAPTSPGPFTAGGTTIAFATSSTSTPASPSEASDPSDPSGTVIVHAAGAIVTPGVYRLPAGARIGDLVTVAGGLTPDADGNRLNLAEPLADGVRVYVPRVGEPGAPPVQGVDGPGGVAGSSGAGSGAPGGGAADIPPQPMELNTATVEQLDELPGVGPTTAQAIVSFRDQNGPFASVDSLLEVRGIGPSKLELIRPLVRVS